MADTFNWDQHPLAPEDTANVPTKQAFDWDQHPLDPNYARLLQAKTQIQAPGALESGALGLEQGATMGFAPRINAGLMAAYKQLAQPSEADFKKDYEENKAEQDALQEKAKATHPWMHGIGEAAGAVGSTIATGGENLAGEGLLGAAKLGAGYGAATGLASSNDLGDVGQDIRNTAAGAGVGFAAGAAGGAASDIIGPLLKRGAGALGDLGAGIKSLGPISDFTQGYGVGTDKGLVVGKQAGLNAVRGANEALSSAQDTFQNALNNASRGAEALRAEGGVIDHSNWFEGALNAVQNAKQAIPEADVSKQAALDKIHQIIAGYGNEWGDQLSPTQAVILKRTLGDLGSAGDAGLKDDYARQLVNRLVSPLRRAPNEIESTFALPQDFVPLKQIINEGIEGLPEQVQRQHQLLSAQDDFPDLDTLLNAQKGGRTGVKAQDALGDFYDALPQDVAGQLKPQLEAAANTAAVGESANAPGLSDSVLRGKGLFSKLGNITGATVKGAQGAATAAATDIASSGTGQLLKQALNQPAQWFASAGANLAKAADPALQYVGKAFVGAASKDQLGRNAIIFSLSQNPAYRDVLQKQFGNGSGLDANPAASTTSQKVRGNI